MVRVVILEAMVRDRVWTRRLCPLWVTRCLNEKIINTISSRFTVRVYEHYGSAELLVVARLGGIPLVGNGMAMNTREVVLNSKAMM